MLAAFALATSQFVAAAFVGAAIGAQIWADERGSSFGLLPRERMACFYLAIAGGGLLLAFALFLAAKRGDFRAGPSPACSPCSSASASG